MAVRRNISTELQHIASILQGNNICPDISPINKAIADLKKGFCNIQKLKFKVDTIPNNTRPNVKSLDILLSVYIKEEECPKDNICNVVNEKYNFALEILGKNGERTVHSSWHLDYDNSSESEYVHPCFHLTYGGKAMKAKDLGDLILLPTPRIAYPPMDAILGIDFILSNFLKKNKYNQIKAISQYKTAVKNSQQRLWQPYMLSLARHWCSFRNCSHYKTDTSLSGQYFPTLIE